MTHLAFTLALLFVVFFAGYITGRAQVVRDIKRMTEELNRRTKHEQSN